MVVALTAFAMKGDEQKAVEAGCDGYITKPIDTRSLGARIREYLARRAESHPISQPAPADGAPEQEKITLPAAELQALRRRFLEEGQERSRQMLLDLDGQFNAADAARMVHQWIGTGGLLGYSAISRLAREVEAVLLERPLDNSELRESLTNLALAFTSPREARDAPIPESIVQNLSGKRIAIVGFPGNERAADLCGAGAGRGGPGLLQSIGPAGRSGRAELPPAGGVTCGPRRWILPGSTREPWGPSISRWCLLAIAITCWNWMRRCSPWRASF